MSKGTLERVKAFGMTNQMLAEDLSRIARTHGVELGHMPTVPQTVEDVYYPQFDAAVRGEAAAMAEHYEVFYSLEKSIRELVAQTIEAAEKREDWWSLARVPANVQTEVSGRIQKTGDGKGVFPARLSQSPYGSALHSCFGCTRRTSVLQGSMEG